MRDLFKQTKLKSLNVDNAWFVPPMCTYQANEITGQFNQIHFDHYSAFAIGGFKTIIIESNAVNFNGRLSTNDIVLTKDVNLDLYNKMIDNVHFYGSKIGIQINHGGELSPYNTKFAKNYTLEEINEVIADFKRAIKIANEDLNVDFIEIHGAHGYFLDQIVCQRNGVNWTIQQKQQVILEILNFAIKQSKPVGIRINATDLGTDKYAILSEWKKILDPIVSKLEYISITTLGETRNERLHNLEALKEANKLFKEQVLISCGGINDYEDAQQYALNGATLVGIGTNAFINKNYLYKIATREEGLAHNKFSTLVKLSTRNQNDN